MLEYNADTPSLQLETGILSKEWLAQKYRAQVADGQLHQSNYLDDAYMIAMEAIYSTCEGYGKRALTILVLNLDEENTAVMRYIHSKWNALFKPGLD